MVPKRENLVTVAVLVVFQRSPRRAIVSKVQAEIRQRIVHHAGEFWGGGTVGFWLW